MFKDDVFFSCSCGCGSSMSACSIDSCIYLTFYSSDYFIYQDPLECIKHNTKLLFSKDAVKEFFITEDELTDFCRYLESVECRDEKADNYSHIRIEYEDGVGYCILLVPDISALDVLMGHSHRIYEITLNSRLRDRLVRYIKHTLKKTEQKKSALSEQKLG